MTEFDSSKIPAEQAQTDKPAVAKKPDDAAGVSVQVHVKIHDPESGEVLVSKRS